MDQWWSDAEPNPPPFFFHGAECRRVGGPGLDRADENAMPAAVRPALQNMESCRRPAASGGARALCDDCGSH